MSGHRRFFGLLLLSFLLSLSIPSFATQHPKPAVAPDLPTIVKFVENKGQWASQIRFEAGIPGGKVFFEQDRLTYNLAALAGLHDWYFHCPTNRDLTPIQYSGHAFQLTFPGANAQPRISAQAPYEETRNYFLGNDPQYWAGGVKIYAEVHYQDLYPGVEAVFYGQKDALKYDLILQPGASTDKIRLNYLGLKGIHLGTDGDLIFPTSIGEFREMRPFAYQEVDGERVGVPCEFVINGSEVSFRFPQGYDESKVLVIDPTWVFGTYSGSTADNFGYTATFDTAGNLYGGGIAFDIGYPTTVGAYQTTYAGGGGPPFGGLGFDMSITKFNATGTAIIWSTYIGGSLNEQPQSMIANDAGELVIYGRTWSNNFPITPGAIQPIFGGTSDIVVVKLNSTGSALIGSTFMGGSADDGLNITTNYGPGIQGLYHNYGDDSRGEVMLDSNGNIFVASCSQSPNFPTSPGCLQSANAGLQDAVVFKLNPTLTTTIWSTYLGGSGNDAGYSVKIDAGGTPYVTGGTESPNFPTTNGTVSPGYNGAIDGYIVHFNAAGTALIAGTYIGTNDYDQSHFLEIDDAGDIYIVGQTLGPFPVSPGVYSNPNGAQFVAKFNPTLTTRIYSTVFGNGGTVVDISPTAFLVDRCGFIYVAGWGGADNLNFSIPTTNGYTTGLPTTPAAFQTTTDGSDFYIVIFTPGVLALEYATFYGGAISAEHVDGGTSRFDRNLRIYEAICAGCGSNSDLPTTAGCVSSTNNSFNCNLGVFKFQFDPQDIRADFQAVTLDSCSPFPVNFTNTSQGGVSFNWDFGDGSPNVTTFNASHTYVLPGTYIATLTILDSNSCNIVDSVQYTITVYANPIAVAGGSDTICAGNDIQLTSGGGVIYDWSPGATVDDSTIANPLASPVTNTTYSVIVTDSNGCVDTAYVDVFVTHFYADAGPPTAFCEGTGGAQLHAGQIFGGTGPYYYTWTCDSNLTFCGLDSTFDDDPIANPSQSAWYYLQVSDSRGCVSEFDSAFVEILPTPIANAGPDQFICQPPSPGALLQGSVTNAPGPYQYFWLNSPGLNDTTILNPFARPDTTTIYTLVVISSNGCTSNPTTTDTLSTVTVHVQPRPIADAGPDIHTCLYDTTVIQGLGFGAGPSYSYQWTPFIGLNDSSVANPIASPPFTHTYTLVVWSNGCPSYGDSMTLWVHTLPTPSAGNIREICLGDTAFLDAFAAGDSSASYTYVWTPTLGLDNPTLENPAASPDTSTWYFLTATSSWGCESPLDSVLVRVKPTPIADAGPVQYKCAGDSVVLQGSYYSSSTDTALPADIFYSWTPGTSMNDTTLMQPIVWPTQSTMYHFAVRTNTCETYDSVLVILNPSLGSFAEADTSTICGGDSVQFHAGGGHGAATILWVPTTGSSDPTSWNPTAAPGDTTTYTALISKAVAPKRSSSSSTSSNQRTPEYQSSEAEGCPPHPMSFTDLSDNATLHIWNFRRRLPSEQFAASRPYLYQPRRLWSRIPPSPKAPARMWPRP
ncbi:MAG: PKD domain-containing protein [Bacteroidia bacterium]